MDYRLGAAAEAAGHRLVVHDSLGSTNTEALDCARSGETGPLWVVARRQEAGRGRRGNAWTSPPGNLAASLLLAVDDVDPGKLATLGFVAGVALVDALDVACVDPSTSHPVGSLSTRCVTGAALSRTPAASAEGDPGTSTRSAASAARSGWRKRFGRFATSHAGPRIVFRYRSTRPGKGVGAGRSMGHGMTPVASSFTLKWPNDVLLRGAKLAGILLEAETLPGGRRIVVIGFGVNVAASPEGLPYAATCLRQCGYASTAEDVFAALSDSIVDALGLWRRGDGFPDVRARWIARAAGIDAPVTVRLGDERVQGIFETIDEAGRLVIASNDGTRRTVTAGEVHFGTAATAA